MRIKLLTLYFISLICNLLTAQTVQWSVKPTYSSLEEYVGKLYKYRENGKVGLVDISGKVLVEAKYDSITPFIDYHALALEISGGDYMLKGIINQNNLRLVEISDGYYLSKYLFFSEGKLVVSDRKRKYGYMLTDGSFLTECKFDKAFPFYHNRALVHLQKGKDSEVYYLQEDGDVFVTKLQRESFCFGLNCSSFNEDGVALVHFRKKAGARYAEMTVDGKVIKEYKREDDVNTAKKIAMANYVKRNSNFVETSNLLPIPVESNVLPIKDGRGVFGFHVKGMDELCVLAQFTEAFSFKDGYAKVKINGKYGVLKLIPDVSFDGAFLQNKIEVLNGKFDSLKYVLNLPQHLYKTDWNLKIEDMLGDAQSYTIKRINDKIQFVFKPNLNKETKKNYKLSLSADDLLLWEDHETITFKYLYPTVIHVDVPRVDVDRHIYANGYYTADEHDRLRVYSKITNKLDEDVEVQVKMGARYKGASDNLTVTLEDVGRIKLKANSTKEFKASIENVIKEGELEIYIQTSDNGKKQINIIKVKPRK